MPIARTLLRPILLALLLLNAGCATRGPELTASVTAIRTSVSNIDAESQKVFADINAKNRDDVIQLLILQSQGPSEAAFVPVISADTSARWSAAFNGLQTYLGALQTLVDAKRSRSVTTDLGAIGQTLQSDSFGLTVPKGATGLFSKLGGALIQARSEAEASRAMHVADPDFNRLMTGLADMVTPASGPATDGSLRQFLETHWNSRLVTAENAYRTLQNPTTDQRRKALTDYGQLIDQREADRMRLVRLREALLAAAEAHAEAAKGDAGTTFYWLDQLNDFLKAARDEAEKGK